MYILSVHVNEFEDNDNFLPKTICYVTFNKDYESIVEKKEKYDPSSQEKNLNLAITLTLLKITIDRNFLCEESMFFDGCFIR